jgi:predicted amidophosphoribosyltransferase
MTQPRCPHCGIPQHVNDNADPALSAMDTTCWKCAKPLTVFVPGDEVRDHLDRWTGVVLEPDHDGVTVVSVGDAVHRINTMFLRSAR